MGKRGNHVKMNFDYFQIQKRMLQKVRAEKVDEKNGKICISFCCCCCCCCWQFKDHNSRRKHGNYTDSVFSSSFSTLTVCIIHFWIWKFSKFIFMCFPLWSIQACNMPQFFAKNYRIGQFIILFYKVDTLRLLKIFIISCQVAGAKYPLF